MNNPKMSYDEWVYYVQHESDYPNTDETYLALKVLKICVYQNKIDELYSNEVEHQYEITQNGYALFDYTMLCYFLLRGRLCEDFSRCFVENFDAFFQRLLESYFLIFYDIPQYITHRMIIARAGEYDTIMKAQKNDAMQQILDTIVIFFCKDFCGEPECKEVPIVSAFQRLLMYKKVAEYSKDTLDALDREVNFIFEKQREHDKQVPDSKQKYSLREHATSTLGLLGIILSWVVRLIVSILPFVMIGANFIVTLLLVVINIWFPITTIIFWIWGFICAVNGIQSFWTVVYYICAIVIWLPFFVDTVVTLFREK